MKKWIVVIFLSVCAVLVQISIVPWALPVSFISVPVVLAILYAFSSNTTLFFGAACSIGIMNDFFSPLPFGTHFFVMLFLAWVIHVIVVRFLTNRSSYALFLLSLLGTALYWGLLFGASFIIHVLVPETYQLPLKALDPWQFVSNAVLAFAVFFLHTLRKPPKSTPTAFGSIPL